MQGSAPSTSSLTVSWALSFQTLSTPLKPPGSPTQQQALNVHFNTAPCQKDVELLGFAQMYYECDSLAQICADVFLAFLPHKDIGIGKVIRVAGCSKLTGLFDWELKRFLI